jgi:hypothetical protein
MGKPWLNRAISGALDSILGRMTETPPSDPHIAGTAESAPLAKVTSDFDFLVGRFDVINRRLINPLTGSEAWEEFPATAIARTHFNGAISVDEMCFPTKGFFGMSIRLFNPVAREWTVYWVNSKTGALQAPVRGRWADGASLLFGDDEHDGTPVRASYQWSEVKERTAHWEQAFSVDNGETWETNWTMDWSRRDDEPEVAPLPKLTEDFDFLVGRWSVTHRRLSRLGSDDWSVSAGTAIGWTYFNGGVSMDEFHFPTHGTRGLTVRLFDPGAKTWSIYWVSSVDGRLQPPVHGGFDRRAGEFYGDDVYNNQPIRVRFLWSRISARSARWEQAFSTDAGETWDTNWVMYLTRIGDEPG